MILYRHMSQKKNNYKKIIIEYCYGSFRILKKAQMSFRKYIEAIKQGINVQPLQEKTDIKQIPPTVINNRNVLKSLLVKPLFILFIILICYLGINLFTPDWLPERLRLINFKKKLENLSVHKNISSPTTMPTPTLTSILSPTQNPSPKKIIYITATPQTKETILTEPTEQNNTNQNININTDQSTQSQSQSITTEGTSQSVSTSCNQGKCTKVTCKNGSCTTEVYNK